MLPVAFDNRGGLAGTEQRGGAAALRRRVCTTVVMFVRVAVLFPACFHLILKQNLLCVIGCVSVDLCDWFVASCRGRKRACPFFFFLFLPLPTPPHPLLSGSWRGGRRGGQGRVSKGSQVSGWWLRWDTWHAPERLDQWGALLGGSGYVA